RLAWLLYFPALLMLVPGVEAVLIGSAKMIYDAIFPCLLLLFVGGVLAAKGSQRPGLAFGIATLAGLSLSAAELSRTFILVMLPFLILWALLQFFEKRQYRLMLAFLLPLLLLSWGWHLRLKIVHDQLFWSNHGGCNLSNAWLPLIDHRVLMPQLEPEAPPRDAWKFHNLNTDVHTRNCERMKDHIVSQIKADPRRAFGVFWENSIKVVRAPVGMYDHWPEGPVIDLYRWMVRLMYLATAVLLLAYVSRSWRDPRYLYSTDGVMLFICLSLTLFSIIGERWELSRFTVSSLPFLLFLWVRVGQMFGEAWSGSSEGLKGSET
ncbi:MAG: hypothetical protein AAF804_21980, partial [Bacteroidota bacterium]